MKSLSLFTCLVLGTLPAYAETSRQLDAHEHGTGALNIAIEGGKIAMEFEAPGADIVGFEYVASSAEELASIDAAVALLKNPLALFEMPAAAGCKVVTAQAALESEDDHADGHDEDHDDHADEKEGASHTEFHAEYSLECTTPSALSEINFAYFATFPNAQEVDVQIVTDAGAAAFEVERDAPRLDLGSLR